VIVRNLNLVPLRLLTYGAAERNNHRVACLHCGCVFQAQLVLEVGTTGPFHSDLKRAFQQGWGFWTASETEDAALQLLADAPREGWICSDCIAQRGFK
jgi:hypothetical protein